MTTNGERAVREDEKDDDVDAMTVVQLKDELRRRKLKTSGVKTMLAERLRAAILLDGQKDEETDDDDDEDRDDPATSAESDDDDDGNQRRDDVPHNRKTCVLTFKDVEDSIDTFSGDDGRSIKQWIRDLEETAKLCKWSEVQKTIYAKKLLRGSARLFIKYEAKSNVWKDIKLALKREFSLKIDSHEVHKQLAKRKKKDDETYHEYFYRMLEIASQAKVEISAVIQYIIDGITDDEVNKVILYDAKSITELKRKLDIYDTKINLSIVLRRMTGKRNRCE